MPSQSRLTFNLGSGAEGTKTEDQVRNEAERLGLGLSEFFLVMFSHWMKTKDKNNS